MSKNITIEIFQYLGAIILSLIVTFFISKVLEKLCTPHIHKPQRKNTPTPKVVNIENFISSVISLMVLNVWGCIFAFFFGNPIISISIKGNSDFFVFLAVVMLIIGSMRVINITAKELISTDVLIWLNAASGVFFFLLITDPAFITSPIETLLQSSKATISSIVLMLSFVSLVISLLIEFCGNLILKIRNLRD